jgi:hypothetical protein
MVTGKRTEAILANLKGLHLPSCHLAINMVDGYFSYLITDVNTKRHLKKARLEFDFEDLDGILSGLSSGEPFRSVSYSSLTYERTIIPDGLFKESRCREYLDVLYDLNHGHTVTHEPLGSMDCQMVYTEELEIRDLCISHFPTIKFHHGASILLESMVRENQFEGAPHVLIHTRENLAEIMIVMAKKPMFFNSFDIQNETDLCYHLLHTLEVSNIDYQHAEVSMGGNISSKDSAFKLIQSYCPKLKMINFKGTLPGLRHLSEDELGRDAVLINQYQCGL